MWGLTSRLSQCPSWGWGRLQLSVSELESRPGKSPPTGLLGRMLHLRISDSLRKALGRFWCDMVLKIYAFSYKDFQLLPASRFKPWSWVYRLHLKVVFIFVVWLLSCVWLLCGPMDCSPPGPTVHGTYQARLLQQIAISSSRRSSQPRNSTCISCIGRYILYRWATREAPKYYYRLVSI